MTRLSLQRIAYLTAALATLVGPPLGMIGFARILGRFHDTPAALWIYAVVPVAMAGGFLLMLLAAFLQLARKPQAWGKIICAVGVPWIAFTCAAIMMMEMAAIPSDPLLYAPGLAGAVMLSVGALLLAVDRGWLGRPC